MSWKNSSIVSYPDSDDDNDPLHYIRKSRPKQENVQYNPVYKNKIGRGSGHPRDPRLESRNRDPRLQPRNNETRDPRHQSSNVENRDPRQTAKSEMENIHYAPVYNRNVRDIGREYENLSRSNSYESAGARWKQYKSEKAAEISRPEKYQSAESGWKKLKSENKWDTSNWTNASDSSDDDEDNYKRKTPKSKIDIFANSEDMEETYKEEQSTEKGFWWKYKDDEPLPDSLILEHASKSEEKNDDLFDDILSGNLLEGNKSNAKTDEFNDDFLYEDVLMQSRKVLEEGKAFLGESVTKTHDEGSDHHKFKYDTGRSFMNDSSSSSQFRPEDFQTQNRYNDGLLYREHVNVDDRKDDDLYKRVDDEFGDGDDTWARSVTVEKKEVSNWSDESLSPIRHDEPSPDRDVEVNLVKKISPGRPRDDSPSYQRSRENRKEDALSPYANHESRENRKRDSYSYHEPRENRKDDNISSYSNRSPPNQATSRRDSSHDHPGEPPVSQSAPREPPGSHSAQPIIRNPYENPKLNVDNIDLYFSDLMEWNYSHRCLICDKTFDNLTKWTEHILDTKHGREFHLDPYRCPPCHEMFRNKQEWKMHMMYAPSHGFMGSINVPKTYTVLPPSPAFPVQHGWRCRSCYIISQTDEDALRHIKYVHLIHTALYPCPLCGEPFWHQRDLDRHADDVHAPPKYQCDICQRAFESGEKLQTHRLIKHSKKITCYRCEKQIDELIFKEHCEMHKLEMRKCDYCGDVFKDSYHLEKHVRNDHKKHRRRHRSSSRSPDRRSSRRRSRRSRSRSRSSSKSRRSSAKDELDKKEDKSHRSTSPTNQELAKEKPKDGKRAMSQDDSSIPSSGCATPTRDEEEDIFPPGDENYRHTSPNPNHETIEVAPVEEENSRQSREHSASRSPRDRRDSIEEHRHSRESDKSRDYRRSRSTTHSSRDRRSSHHEKSRSRDDYSYRRYSSSKRNRSQSRSRSRSRSRDRGYDERKGSRYADDDRGDERCLENRDYKESEDRSDKNDGGKRLSSENLNDSSSNALDDTVQDDVVDEEETEWERRISVKMIVKDEIWDKEEDEKSDNAPVKTAPKDLPIFDIPLEEDNKKVSSEKPIENATWVVEKPQDENKDSKNDNESDEEDKKQFVCKECGKSLGSLMQLRDHFTVKHKKGYNLRNKRPSSADVKKSQPIVAKEPKLSEEQKEIAKLIEGIE